MSEWVNNSGQVGVSKHVGRGVVCTPECYAYINAVYMSVWTGNMNMTGHVHVKKYKGQERVLNILL